MSEDSVPDYASLPLGRFLESVAVAREAVEGAAARGGAWAMVASVKEGRSGAPREGFAVEAIVGMGTISVDAWAGRERIFR